MFLWKKKLKHPPPRLALVAIVRNEAAWLPAFLSYHQAVGVERAFLFCDRCTDASEAIARSFSWVTVLRVDAIQVEQFHYVCDIHCACMNFGLRLARQEGFDWLLTIDPDEFASGDNPGESSAIGRAHLGRLLQRVRPETVQIRLPTWEVAPTALPAGTPFWEHRYFQTTPRLTWTIFDPLCNRHDPWHDFLGHRQGKSIIRTSAEAQAYDSHRWVPEQSLSWPQRPEFAQLATEDAGSHRHFFVTSQQHWQDKFPKHMFEAPVWFCGKPVELPKQCWKRLAAEGSAEQRRGYFDRWLARPEAALRQLAKQGAVREDSTVADVLRETGLLHGQTLQFTAHPCGFEPVSFQPLTAVPASAQTACGWTATKLPASQRQGFYNLERAGVDFFRWTAPHAAVLLPVPPGDYRLHLDMKRLSKLWAGRLDLALNDRPAPRRDRQFKAGILSQLLHASDFPAADNHWLHMKFAPINTSSWPGETRALGAPLFSIFLDPCEK